MVKRKKNTTLKKKKRLPSTTSKRRVSINQLHRESGRLILIFSILALACIWYVVDDTHEKNYIDERATRLETYFKKYNMPLAAYSKTFIEVADTCDMDWRLLPAIGVQESSGGKRMQYNNPFGWGGAKIPFTNLDEAIRVVGGHLCGTTSSTAKWYSTTSTQEKLYYYNGTVNSHYPDEVMWIMEQF